MLNLRENMELVYQREEPEYMPFMSDFDVASLDALDFVNERPVVPGVNKDWFGQSWTYEPKVKAANPTPGCPLVTDITLWKEQMTFPDIDALDWEGHAARDTASWDRKNKMSRITIGFGLWERMFSVMPFDDALCALMEEPEACYDFFSAVADHKIRLHDKILKYYKPDILVMHDDYGTSQGLFMSVKVWRELIKPHLKRVVEHVQSYGCIYEHHNCGYFDPLTNDMLEIGIHATNPVHISNDLEHMKKTYGKDLTMVGGFHNQLLDSPRSTEEEIRASVRKTMDIMAPGGGYIPRFTSTSNAVTIVMDEITKYSANFYQPRPEFR